MADATQAETEALLPTLFRKRPGTVTAWQYHGGPLLQGDPDWVAEKTEPVCAVGVAGIGTVALRVFTPHGPTTASPKDWIIKGPSGDVWPCKPEVFEATYESAALTPKPLSVAPEDEAHFKALAQCVHDCGDGDTDSQAVREYGYVAIEALRRRFAELRAHNMALEADNASYERTFKEQKAALAACRRETIEECAALAADYAKIRGGYIPVDPIKAQNEAAKEIAAGIRALKSKENGNG